MRNHGECDNSKYRMMRECYIDESLNIMSSTEVVGMNLFHTHQSILISINYYHINTSIRTDTESSLFMSGFPAHL